MRMNESKSCQRERDIYPDCVCACERKKKRMLRFYFVSEKIVSIDMPNDYLATIALIILLRGNKGVKPMEIS